VAAVKASFFMFFNYLVTMGVPVLLLLLALDAMVIHSGILGTVLKILIGVGSLVYGAIGIREVFVHGRRRRETADR
jgi:hypothetical protein